MVEPGVQVGTAFLVCMPTRCAHGRAGRRAFCLATAHGTDRRRCHVPTAQAMIAVPGRGPIMLSDRVFRIVPPAQDGESVRRNPVAGGSALRVLCRFARPAAPSALSSPTPIVASSSRHSDRVRPSIVGLPEGRRTARSRTATHDHQAARVQTLRSPIGQERSYE